MAFTKTGDRTKAQILADSAFVNKVTANRVLGAKEKKAILTACEFIPAVSGNWTTNPETVDAALNELGARTSVGNDVANLVTLTGVAVDSTTLGTFTGATIPDSQTIKAAFQALETAMEAQKPSHIVKFAGKHTVTAGEDPVESAVITVTGVAATDIVVANFEVAAAGSIVTALVATPTLNTVTISGTLTENDIISYVVYRALS